MGSHVHQDKLGRCPATPGVLALLLLLLLGTARAAEPRPVTNPMLTITKHLRRAMRILDRHTRGKRIRCQYVLKKLSAYVKKSSAECRRARRRLARMSARARARTKAGSERAVASIMGRYSQAVVRFDSACPEHTHRLEEIIDELVAGPGHASAHHKHQHDSEEPDHDHQHHRSEQKSSSRQPTDGEPAP